MRWDELFADLEGQLEAGLGAEERDREAEEERLRLGRVTLRDRLAALAGETVRVRLTTGATIGIAPRTIGRDWIAGDLDGSAAHAVLPLSGVAAVLPQGDQLARSAAPVRQGALTDRLGVAFVLRDLARRRRAVELHTDSGVLSGTLDAVGADHLTLAVHPSGEWRRAAAVSRIELVPLGRLVLVRLE